MSPANGGLFFTTLTFKALKSFALKSKIFAAFSIVILTLFSISLVYGWGFWGHKRINRSAVFALPDEMRTFYYNHIDFVTEGSVVPDLRRALINDKNEPGRHFIDIEDFNLKP